MTEELTRRVDQNCFVANPPIHRIGQLLFLMRPDPYLGHMGQGKALVGAGDQAGLAGIFLTQHQVPRQLIERAATLHVVQQIAQAAVQRTLLRLDIRQTRIGLHRRLMLTFNLQTLVTIAHPPRPDQQRHHQHNDTGRDAHCQFTQRLTLAPGPLRAQPPDGDQQKHHAQQHQYWHRLVELTQHRQAPAFEVTPDRFHESLLAYL